MRLAATNINKAGVRLSCDKLRSCAFVLTGRIGKALYKLYDLGYLSSPSEFNRETVLKGLIQEFPEDINILMSNIDGNFNIDSLRIKYGIKVTGNSAFKEVLEAIYSYYSNKEELEAVNKLLSKSLVSGKSEISFNPKISVSESVITFRCQVDLTSKAIRSCLIPDEGFEFKEYRLSHLVMLGLCKKVGISEEVFNSHNREGKAIFLEGLSLIDESDLIVPLIKGELPTYGEYGSALEKSIMGYYKDIMEDTSVRYGRVNFEDDVYSICFMDRMKYVDAIRKKVSIVGGREYLLTQTSIIFQVPSGTLTKNTKCFSWDLIGNFALDWHSESELQKVNLVEGISGEFISNKACSSMGYKKSGAPVVLKSVVNLNNGEVRVDKGNYYNIANVVDSNGFKLEPLVGKRFAFVFSDISTVFSKFGVSSQEELTQVLSRKVITSFNIPCNPSDYKMLVSDIVVGLIFMDCGYPDFNSGIQDKSFITEDIFYKACYDAEMLFKSLGF